MPVSARDYRQSLGIPSQVIPMQPITIMPIEEFEPLMEYAMYALKPSIPDKLQQNGLIQIYYERLNRILLRRYLIKHWAMYQPYHWRILENLRRASEVYKDTIEKNNPRLSEMISSSIRDMTLEIYYEFSSVWYGLKPIGNTRYRNLLDQLTSNYEDEDATRHDILKYISNLKIKKMFMQKFKPFFHYEDLPDLEDDDTPYEHVHTRPVHVTPVVVHNMPPRDQTWKKKQNKKRA